LGIIYLDHYNEVQFDPTQDGRFAREASLNRVLLSTADDLVCLALVGGHIGNLTGVTELQNLGERLAFAKKLRDDIRERVERESRPST
jgi:hypothetical protein